MAGAAEALQGAFGVREGMAVDLRTGKKLAEGFFKRDLVGCFSLLSVDWATLRMADEVDATGCVGMGLAGVACTTIVE